jgi:chromosome segregation ATPase
MNDTKKKPDPLEEHLETLKKKGPEGNEAVITRVNELTTAISELGATAMKQAKSTLDLSVKLQEHDKVGHELFTLVDRLSNRVNDMTNIVRVVAETSDKLVTKDAELLELLEGHDKRRAEFEARMAGADERTAKVEERVAKLEAAQPTAMGRAGKGVLIALGALTVGAVAGGVTAGVVIRRQDRRREAEARRTAAFTGNETAAGGSLPPGVQSFVN